MIRVDQPKQWDLVSNKICIAGIGTGFEAVINYRISDGHDEIASYISVGGGTGEHAQFQKKVDVSEAAFTLDRVFVDVYEASAKDRSDLHKTTIPVLLGGKIVEGYIGYRRHKVVEGDTLIKIARQHYGTDDWQPIKRANINKLERENIWPGEILRVPIGYP